MNWQGIVGVLVIGFYLLGALILIGIGQVDYGKGMLEVAFGIVIGYFFPSVKEAIKRRMK
jgi:urea transporter